MTTKEMNRMRSLRKKRALVALLAAVSVALAAPGNASADSVAPQVRLGPTTILNGLAVLSGSVNSPTAGVALSVNGQPLQLSAAGHFAGVANLNGQSVLTLSSRNVATGDSSTVTIPLNTNLIGPGGVLAPDALAALQQALVTILRPVDGFSSVGDEPVEVSGSVGNSDNLASFSINGIDVFSLLKPDGSFVVPVPGLNREVVVQVTDRQGVALETYYAAPSRSVSAARASGVRITKIRYFAKGIKRTKRLRMVVTVKDRANRMIQDAVVTVRSAKTRRIMGRAKVKRTNRNGKVTFVLRVRRAAFGKRTTFVATAKTPSAKATKRTAVRLPRVKAKRR
jgi:hypothetical protein